MEARTSEDEFLDTEPLLFASTPYEFPQVPFESIGFALSGGGFRAASYGLGVLSLLNAIQWTEEAKEVNLLQKVRFVSSASGGTIPLCVYLSYLHSGIPFTTFYQDLKNALTGEALVGAAMDILKDDGRWAHAEKSRNIINAFSIAYHEHFFSRIPPDKRVLGLLSPDVPPAVPVHVNEFCFNATEFYTGVSFRFQANTTWLTDPGGAFGNGNIHLKNQAAIPVLQQLRLSDVLAASSCFPMGFEPIVFPKDFTYPGGPSVEALKNALVMDTLSWRATPNAPNEKSARAAAEKEFVDKQTFGLMDGGIWDNQGLYSLLLADGRDVEKNEAGAPKHRFDLLMVSDVTSYYMSPYTVPEINTQKAWMQETLQGYWNQAKRWYQRMLGWGLRARWIGLMVGLLCMLPLFLEGRTWAGVMLAVLGLLICLLGFVVTATLQKRILAHSFIAKIFASEQLEGWIPILMPKDSFAKRTTARVVNYMQEVPLGIFMQMVNARAQSAATMIGDVFLKHVRRLIYARLFENSSFFYRRLDNVIYKLTYSGDKGRKLPAFEPRENEDPQTYAARRTAFRAEVQASCLLSAGMQDTAELAYNTGTTMWFEPKQEDPQKNNRLALIATGQFTTCYNLLEYALSLRHSRHFSSLDDKHRARVDTIIDQLKALMIRFVANPYHMV